MVGPKIRKLRIEAGMERKDLAGLAGVPLNSLANWENEKCEPNVNQAAMVATILGVSLDGLTGIGPEQRDERIAQASREKAAMRAALIDAQNAMMDAREELRKATMQIQKLLGRKDLKA